MFKSTFFFLLVLTFLSPLKAQSIKSNFDIASKLVDSAIMVTNEKINRTYELTEVKLNLPEQYNVFTNKLKRGLGNLDKPAKSAKDTVSLSFSLIEVKTEYGETFKDGFFGDYFVVRKISLQGDNFIGKGGGSLNKFSFASVDTVGYNDIKEIESSQFPFTQSKHPDAPFFSSIYEPVIIIGSAALAAILFFTVRSN